MFFIIICMFFNDVFQQISFCTFKLFLYHFTCDVFNFFKSTENIVETIQFVHLRL